MGGRITAFLFAGTLLAATQAVLAQGHGHVHGGTNPWAAPDARQGGTSPAAFSGHAPAFPPGMYDPTYAEPERPVRQATFFPPPPQQPAAYCPPEDRAWWEIDPRLRELTVSRLRGTYFRADYLIWEIEEPGNRLLGSTPTTVNDPREPFLVFDLQNPPNLIGSAVVPTTDPFQFKDVPGVRAVVGTPLNIGTLEFEGFLTEQADQQFIPAQFFGAPNAFIANTTKIDGELSGNVQLYDDFYSVTYTSELWGAAGRVYLEGTDTGHLRLQPTIGFRYVALQESLVQNGIFTRAGEFAQAPAGVTQRSLVRSDVFNNVYGVELGARFEADWWILTAGVHPWLTLGPNTLQNRVTTENFVTIADPLRVNTRNETIFGPALGLGAYLEARLYDHATLRFGYDLLWLTRVQRPAEGIDWNIDDESNTSRVGPRRNLNSLLVEGLTIGLEIRIP